MTAPQSMFVYIPICACVFVCVRERHWKHKDTICFENISPTHPFCYTNLLKEGYGKDQMHQQHKQFYHPVWALFLQQTE